LHVGVVRVGGIGDDLMLAAHCLAIKRRFPHAHITAFVRDNSGILAGHPGFDRIVVRCGGRWLEIVRDLRERFDIFYDLRYAAKVWAFTPDYKGYEHECRAAFEPLAWYYHNWYDSNARLAELGKHLIDLTNETICCSGGVEDVRLWLRPEDRKLARLLAGRDYAVVHNGAGGSCVAKLWSGKHWAALAAWLRGAGLEVFQVGWRDEPLIEGAHDLRGFSTLRETAGLIEGARVVVDTEGSLIHIAQAVGQKNAVVLYGPTPPVCFRYPGHEAVATPLECRGCWYAAPDWHVRCPRGYDGFRCMEALKPEHVVRAVERVLGTRDARSVAQPQELGTYCDGLIKVRTANGAGCPLSLVIAIPTRDRPDALARLLESIGQQTMLPARIVIVDDNREAGQVVTPRLGVPVDIIRGPRRGPAWAHQVAVNYLSHGGGAAPDLILRLDDDLVLESRDFVERLWRVMRDNAEVGAAGGVYPDAGRPEVRPIEYIGAPGYSLTIAGMLAGEDSAQFYRWDKAGLVEAEHLYSSFMYRREAAVAVGGFATWYSTQAHREETDFTHRLQLAGWKLVVDTGAVARHEQCGHGGLRAVAREELRQADEMLFVERLRGGALEREAGSAKQAAGGREQGAGATRRDAIRPHHVLPPRGRASGRGAEVGVVSEAGTG
jgi:ADP-heptose:LPS heptosyltransferase/GT2 family glycosyltransferase